MTKVHKLSKIHKPGIPLRPIVSFVNSPTYAISGYLARILSPVVGNTDYTVKNSWEIADFIRDKTINACEELCDDKFSRPTGKLTESSRTEQ